MAVGTSSAWLSACISGEPRTAMSTVPPAGGCSVRVTFISMMVLATATGAASTGDPIGTAATRGT